LQARRGRKSSFPLQITGSLFSKQLKTETALFVRPTERCILLDEDIPRRLRRFSRKQQPVSQARGSIDFGDALKAEDLERRKEVNKQITMQLALDEVERFKERHKRLPKKKEYDRIAESIYKQLKDEKKRKRLLERHEKKAGRKAREKRYGKKQGKKEPGTSGGKQFKLKENAFAELKNAAKGISTKEIEGMKVEDLFGTEKKEKKNALGDEFSLEGMSDLDSGTEENGGCPKCGNRTEDIAFCPECGTAFCENCAKSVKKVGNSKSLTCPKCGNKVKH
jgi:hypothetical protein